MSNAVLAWCLGAVVFALLAAWILGLLSRDEYLTGDVDREEDGRQAEDTVATIVAATQPGALESTK
jgi:hypothetical protein